MARHNSTTDGYVYGLLRTAEGDEEEFRAPAEVERHLMRPGNRLTVEWWDRGYGVWREVRVQVDPATWHYRVSEEEV